jgi:2,3-bisphosphoglycerate-independent phosphoglycerate mutase
VKAVVILGDGMADYPVPELGGQTPLMAAATPAMDRIAKNGRNGLFRTIGPGMSTGSAVANLSVLGYDPAVDYTGRGVLEAASLGIPLNGEDLVLRVNLIHVADGKLSSHSAGHITNEEAGALIADLAAPCRALGIRLHQGLSYRHLAVLKGGDERLECAEPHDHIGEAALDLMVRPLHPDAKATADLLNRMILVSQGILENHPVNQKRKASGKPPANSLWPWSPGRKPFMESFQSKYGVSGAVISAVDLIKGIAVNSGMDAISVEGATGLYDTNYEGKADACLHALKTHDFVYVHVEAPDEAGHDRNLPLKIRCIEDLDLRCVGRILDGLRRGRIDAVVAVLPDHPTPVGTGSHARDPVPAAVWDPRLKPDAVERFDEESAKSGVLGIMEGGAFIKTVLGEKTG